LEEASSPNLFIIGDPNQAIYGFRGADIGFIKRFADDFPGAKVYKLGKSYRCSDRILEASGNVVYRRNTKSFLKGLNKGVKIKIVPAKTGKSEAEFIARKIEEMIGGLRFFSMDSSVASGEKAADVESLSDFAVLCRTKSQFAVIEKAFNDHSIPYQIIGETPFFKRSPVKELIDILKFIHNPENSLIKEKIDSSVVNKIGEDILSLQEQHPTGIIEFIDEQIMKEELKQNPLEFKKIKALADTHKTLSSLITFVTLGKETDTIDETNESVPIMTIHASKGLEFKCVFIAGCEEGLIPYKLFSNSKTDLEEEKRLFYVGMTRAEKLLYLTHASKRYIKGKENNYTRSSFIDKIEKELLETEQQECKRKKAFHNQLSLFDS
jgi:superfamily I DNA/RNA helicase